MPDTAKLNWAFFGFSGRLGRQSFALGGLLLYVLRLFPVYKILTTTDEAAASFWGGAFLIVVGLCLASHVAMTAKRLHDLDKSGWWAMLFIVGDIVMYLVLCFLPGTPGPNRYGSQSDSPR